ncbi:hypothetical protein GCM10027614_55550 [Micromonospora vulcania]
MGGGGRGGRGVGGRDGRRFRAAPVPAGSGRPLHVDGERELPLEQGRPTIADEQQAGLGRRTIDSLRAGVVVLDTDDVPVLINPAARAMGLLRTGSTPGSIAAHP